MKAEERHEHETAGRKLKRRRVLALATIHYVRPNVLENTQ